MDKSDVELSEQEEFSVLYASEALKEESQYSHETFGSVSEMEKEPDFDDIGEHFHDSETDVLPNSYLGASLFYPSPIAETTSSVLSDPHCYFNDQMGKPAFVGFCTASGASNTVCGRYEWNAYVETLPEKVRSET